MTKRFQAPDICPVCGEDVPRNAKACPECGADEESGWKEGALEADSVGTGSDEFDYERFVDEEFGRSGPEKPAIGWLWWLVALLLLLLMILPLLV
jgi:hypothetical protein